MSADGKTFAGIGGAAVLALVVSLRFLGQHGAAFVLEASHSASTLRGNLDEIARGSYARTHAVDLFCDASSSLVVSGGLPDQAMNWQDFVEARTIGEPDAEKYFEGEAKQLQTAVEIAQRNPAAAKKYLEACTLR